MSLFPDGRPLDDKKHQWWIVPHGLSEYVLLRQLGFDIPNPFTCYYDWSGGAPFRVQKLTGSLLTAAPRGYVLNDMGTGKTRAVLWAWDYLYGNKMCGKLLVVGKLSNLSLTWASESFEVLPHRRLKVLHGTKAQRLKNLADPDADIFVINHDGLKVIQHELAARADIDVLAIDELATFRNPNDRSKLMAKFAKRFKFVWGLTGSPMPHEPTDVWQQCQIITPHTVPKRRSWARDMLMLKQSEHVWIAKADAVERAYSWMQPAVRFSLNDVVELPAVVVRDVHVPLTPMQQVGYTRMKNDLVHQFGADEVHAANAAGVMNKLLQITGGYVYTSKGKTVALDCDPRKEMLVDLIEQSTKKVLVFFPFRHMVTGLSDYVGNTIEHAVIHGDISVAKRNKIFDDFQNTSKYKAIFAHPLCMSHGLTLTAANTIIWWLPLADYEVYEQANARIRRVGQNERQQIFHLHSTPIESKVYGILRRKGRAQDLLLALFEEATTQAQQTP